jgi:biuret amidohydrolase
VRGEYGHDFVDELRPERGELVIDKSGFGAFHATDLRERLGIRGITHLLITGVTTQCCVFSTLREAVDRGYYCLTIRDGTAAFEPDLHEATMRMIASEGHLFGWISDSTRLLETMRDAPRSSGD